jgi:FkbM family methyltransferase
MKIIQRIQSSLQKKRQWYKKKVHDREITRIQNLPRFKIGYTSIFGKPFKFHENLSFIRTYEELFQQEIYRFTPLIQQQGTIIDCGANMGVSVLFFALNYPNHRIVAFEPDPFLFDILKENVSTFQLGNVELVKKAVWTEETELDFYTDGGMGGRVNQRYEAQTPGKVQTVALVDFLKEGTIDFLKIDIEGAETDVIFACSNELKNVSNLFFEYHNVINKEQTLHELLKMLKEQGFTYYIKESGVRERPFIDMPVICEAFDMALNVFCYKSGYFNRMDQDLNY